MYQQRLNIGTGLIRGSAMNLFRASTWLARTGCRTVMHSAVTRCSGSSV